MLRKFRRKVNGVLLVFLFLSIFSGIPPFAPQAVSAEAGVTQMDVTGWTDTGAGWKLAVINAGKNDVTAASAAYSDGKLTLNATGGSFYKMKPGDSSLFTYRQVSGDFSITVRLTSPAANTTNVANADAILMVRNSIESTSNFYDFWVAPVYATDTKTTVSSSARGSTTSDPGRKGNDIKINLTQYPAIYMRLQRQNDLFSTAYSVDGVNWTDQAIDQSFVMEQEVYVGIAIQDLTATFDEIEVVEGSTILPRDITPPSAEPGSNKVKLTWSPTNYAASYNVKRSTDPDGPYTTIASRITGTSYEDTSAVNGTQYYYVISGVNSLGEGANSDAVPAAPVFSAPTGLTVGGEYLTWLSVTDAVYYKVKYSIDQEGPFIDAAPKQEETSFNHNTFLTDKSYYFVVTAIDDGENESLPSEAILIYPGGIDDRAPVIEMTSLPNRTVYGPNVQMEGTVSEACYLDITLNGSLIAFDSSDTRLILDVDDPFSETLTLSEGMNEISIRAKDETGNTAQLDYTIQYKVIRTEDFEGIDVGNPTSKGSLRFDEDYNIFYATGAGSTGLTKNVTGGDQGYLVGVKMIGDYSFGGKMHFKYIEGVNINYTTIGITIRQSAAHDSLHVTFSDQYGGKPITRRAARIFNASGELTASGNNLSNLPYNEGCYFKMIKTGNNVEAIISFDPIPDDLSKLVMTKTLKDGTVVTNSVRTEYDAIGLGYDAAGIPMENYAGFYFNPVSPTLLMPVTFEDITIVMADGTVAYNSNEGKPVPPKNITAKPYNESASINWNPLSTATSYTVYQSEAEAGPFAPVTDAEISIDTVANKVTAWVNGLENDKTYYFYVTASNESGESVKSEIVSIVPGAWVLLPPVITMTSAEPDKEVFSAVLPLEGSVSKAGTLTITHNGNLVSFGEDTSLLLGSNEGFCQSLILKEGVNNIQIRIVDDYDMETIKTYELTYTYKTVDIDLYDADGNVLTGLAPGKEVMVSAHVENYVAATKDNVLVAGLYDEQNNLMKYAFCGETLSEGEEEVLYVTLKLPDDVNGYTLKVYLWDNHSNMQPISDVAVFR